MSFPSRWIRLVSFLILLLAASVACRPKDPDASGGGVTPSPSATPPAAAASCQPNGGQLQLGCPSFPNTSPGVQPEWDYFAWNSFIAANWPAQPREPPPAAELRQRCQHVPAHLGNVQGEARGLLLSAHHDPGPGTLEPGAELRADPEHAPVLRQPGQTRRAATAFRPGRQAGLRQPRRDRRGALRSP